jgi:hypothetical protein
MIKIMINLVMNGYRTAPSWLRLMFIVACAWAALWILSKILKGILILIAVIINVHRMGLKKYLLMVTARLSFCDFMERKGYKYFIKHGNVYYTKGDEVIPERLAFEEMGNFIEEEIKKKGSEDK